MKYALVAIVAVLAGVLLWWVPYVMGIAALVLIGDGIAYWRRDR